MLLKFIKCLIVYVASDGEVIQPSTAWSSYEEKKCVSMISDKTDSGYCDILYSQLKK
jgi:hypothetical protein